MPLPAIIVGGASKTNKTMSTKRTVYIIGAVICSTLAVLLRIVNLPVALAYEALNAMASTSDDTADNILENIKSAK